MPHRPCSWQSTSSRTMRTMLRLRAVRLPAVTVFAALERPMQLHRVLKMQPLTWSLMARPQVLWPSTGLGFADVVLPI